MEWNLEQIVINFFNEEDIDKLDEDNTGCYVANGVWISPRNILDLVTDAYEEGKRNPE